MVRNFASGLNALVAEILDEPTKKSDSALAELGVVTEFRASMAHDASRALVWDGFGSSVLIQLMKRGISFVVRGRPGSDIMKLEDAKLEALMNALDCGPEGVRLDTEIDLPPESTACFTAPVGPVIAALVDSKLKLHLCASKQEARMRLGDLISGSLVSPKGILKLSDEIEKLPLPADQLFREREVETDRARGKLVLAGDRIVSYERLHSSILVL